MNQIKTIGKRSHIPYYHQLVDTLRWLLEESLSADRAELLPSENELAYTYGVRRATIRRALSLLEREGLIYKVKGVGSYISKHRVRYPLTTLISTTEDMPILFMERISFSMLETLVEFLQSDWLSDCYEHEFSSIPSLK